MYLHMYTQPLLQKIASIMVDHEDYDQVPSP